MVTVIVITKAAGCSWATVKALLQMTAAERKLSKTDLARARDNYEWLESQTAKRVLEFYKARRNEYTVTSPCVVSTASADAAALAG